MTDNCLLCAQYLRSGISWGNLLEGAKKKTICDECRKKFLESPYENSLYLYNEPMKKFMQQFKFHKDVRLAFVFADAIHKRFQYETIDCVVPIPMHKMRQKERTFAHVDELLISAKIPFEHMLEKITMDYQSLKTREERIRSTDIFRLKEGAFVQGRNIVLFDDIETTGTTLEQATHILLNAGAKSVKKITLIVGDNRKYDKLIRK